MCKRVTAGAVEQLRVLWGQQETKTRLRPRRRRSSNCAVPAVTCEPLPVAAKPGWRIAEGHELIDADPLTVRLREPIERTHPVCLSDKAD